MRLEPAIRIPHHPDPLFRTFDAGFVIKAQLMFDVEAGAAKGKLTIHRHVISEACRLQEARACAHERKSCEFEFLEHLEFGHAERALEYQRGRGVENFKVARIVDDTGRVAVAPFDPHRAAIAKCRHRDASIRLLPRKRGPSAKVAAGAVIIVLDSRLRGNERENVRGNENMRQRGAMRSAPSRRITSPLR
jgi:hypothetical protein